jgi:hypothetical protein
LPLVRRAVLEGMDQGLRIHVSCNFADLGLATLFPMLPCPSGRDFLYVTSNSRVKAASIATESYPFRGIEDLKAIYLERFFPEDASRQLCRAGCFDEREP